jgi:hypothetical protein
MEIKEIAVEIVKKHGKAMAIELVEAVAVPALEIAVKESATPIDDVVLAALKEPLKAALIKLVQEA